MFEGEEIQSGVESEASLEPSAVSEPIETPEPKAAESQESKPKPESTEEPVPFHKHERWIQRDNELKAERQARQDLERTVQDMRREMQTQREAPKGPDKRAAMLERLKTVDPEFAEFVGSLAPQKELEEQRQWRQQYEAQQQRATAEREIDKLHTQNKVSDDLKPRYQLALEAKIRANPNARLEDLPNLYKEVHDDYSKWIDSIKRAERDEYTKAKKADAKVPASTSRGAAVQPAKGETKWSTDRQEALHQVVQRTLAKRNASRDIG